jgi:hypothetical protein
MFVMMGKIFGREVEETEGVWGILLTVLNRFRI